ncbi:P-loop containing nucleoside triphosphate hydrolase protein [Dactylonectria estremocensis]|uniref:P-loop containing nucleoside triphosphate hydrolase protein n=1 Tax=Dactylonectria estremocensis TaxID=1079267 RepID=A0A9P9I9I1_9HYPO|nr:P-loop containing nucleoside triphosphate hydrolase protein [Dactylonectria estremocensis]
MMDIPLGFRRRWIAILVPLVAILIPLVARQILQKIVPSPLPPESGFELVPVDCFNSSLKATGVDIILVHGLGSNPDTTWQKLAKNDPHNHADPLSRGKKYVNWVTDFLCEDLPPDIRRHTRVFFYNYDSYWKRDAIDERRSRLGQELFEEVTSMEVKTPERSIVFVGHSYGGLVVKEALLKAQYLRSRRPVDIFPQIKAIMFLGTPHRGSASASLGVKAAKLFWAFGLKAAPSIVEAVTYDSIELQDMHRQFEAISDHMRIVNFYEKRETQEFWGLWSDLVVKEQSATLDRPNAESIGLDTDHSGLNKFAERDSNYKKIRNRLIELMEAISADAGILESVPEKIEKFYTERSSLSERLAGKLNRPLKGSDQVAHAVAIYGLGGAGKTQLALRYVEKHKLRYDTILWIDAKSEATIRSSFQRCARDLKLLTETYSAMPDLVALRDDPAVRVVLSWLQNRNQLHGEWLVILDNADDLNGGVRDVIPSGIRGNTILISRDIECVEVLPLGSQRLQVDIMEPSEAVSLLLRHLNLGTANVSEDIRGLSLTICENLQHLALAVKLAGAYIRSCCRIGVDPDDNYVETNLDAKGCLEEYLQDYKTHKNRLLKDDTAKRLSSYNL